jgi:predicted nucleic acid-binding protein
MILIDTSVLIGYLKGDEGKAFSKFDEVLTQGVPYGINGLIYQEVLQGARDESEFDTLKDFLGTIHFFELKFGEESYERAAYLYFLCRESGITIRSTVDTLIAETAIENDLLLLHNDTDFFNMAKVVKELRFY